MNVMSWPENQLFPVPFYSLTCYRLQPNGINQHVGAQDEPLPTLGDLDPIPKYIDLWMEEAFEVDVSHGHERKLRVPLQRVSYNSGDHTSYRLTDPDTGELVTFQCAPYAIHDLTTCKTGLREYIHDASFTLFALTSEPKSDEYLASIFRSLLELEAIPHDRGLAYHLLEAAKDMAGMCHIACHREIPTGENAARLGPPVYINHPYRGSVPMPKVCNIQTESIEYSFFKECQHELNEKLEEAYRLFQEKGDQKLGESFICTVMVLCSSIAATTARDEAYHRQQAKDGDRDVFENWFGIRSLYDHARSLLWYGIKTIEQLRSTSPESNILRVIAETKQHAPPNNGDLRSPWLWLTHLSCETLPPFNPEDTDIGKEWIEQGWQLH